MFYINHMELQKIRRHAEAEYPKECCGILMGNRESGQVKKIYQTGNADAVQRQMTHFVIDPLVLYRAEQYAGAENMEIIGFYHSHADYPAVCSGEDKQAMIPGCIYMIVSVQSGVCAGIRTFRKADFQGPVLEITNHELTGLKTKNGNTEAVMKVYISSTLRGFFGRKEKIEIEGTTIRQVLEELLREYPDAEKAVYDENGKIRSFIQIYVNEENVTSEEHRSRVLAAEDEILLLPAIAGGAPEESPISDDRRKEVKLDDAEIDRFNKHLMLKEIGVKGQKRLKAAKVAVIGAGALGSPVIQYLAAAGVGTIRVVDFDEVSPENLQSQVIHGTRDVKRPKTASARDTIRAINPKIKVENVNIKAEADNIEELIEGYDVVADCTDNYKARYLISDACALHGIPLVFGAIYQYEGQVGVFNRNGGPCLRCLFPAPPPVGLVPTCAGSGTISSLPGIIGSIQANEILKLIIGIGEHLDGKILVVDSLNLRSRILDVHKREDCPICGRNPTIAEVEDFDYEDFCGLKQEEDEIPIEGIEADELAERIERGDELTLVDVREPHERAIHRFSDAIAIPIGQLARRQKELNPDIDTIFICKEGQRSILAIRTLREAGYRGPMYNLKGGIDAMKGIIFSNESGWL